MTAERIPEYWVGFVHAIVAMSLLQTFLKSLFK